MQEYSKERVKALRNLVRNRTQMSSALQAKYNLETFCEEHDLFRLGKEYRAGSVFIACPFHKDDAPSLAYNVEKGIFHCFGCNSGGDYFTFVHQYETDVLGKTVGFVTFLERILRADIALQITLGFNSLYLTVPTTLSSLKPVERNTFKINKKRDESYLELQERFLKTDPSIEKIKLFILLMQKGMNPSIISDELMKISKSENSYDLTEIMNSD